MKITFLTFLLATYCVLGKTSMAQDQSQPNTPTLEQTVDFLNNHRHTYYSECFNSEHTDSKGYFTAEFHDVKSLGIDKFAVANGVLVINYQSGKHFSSTSEKLTLEDQTIQFALRSIKLTSLVVEANPAESECREDHAEGASNCGGHACAAVPYHFTIDTPFWVRLKDGQANTYGFGLPVTTQEEGERMVKAILHLIELSGGQTKEVF